MKKIVLVFVVVIIALCSTYIRYGLPWQYYTTSHSFEIHLKAYDEKMVLDQVRFDFLHGKYYGTAYVKRNPELRFHIEKLRNGQIEDGYQFEKLQVEARQEIPPLIKRYISVDSINVELISLGKREVEINVKTPEAVTQQLKNQILDELEDNGYAAHQLFFNTKSK